ncbi:sodium:solute symporter family transporter [Actinocorallia longicatena]
MVPAVVIALTVLAGALGGLTRLGGLGRARTSGGPSDFLVASRSVTPAWNASAIAGEYISAAAFLGSAGLVLAYGVDMLWMPIGAAAGYVVLLALVTGPLRRSGAYTLSDFAEWRLGGVAVRRGVSVCVCFIGWFYLLPQFQGAGVTLRAVAGVPLWAGWALVVVVVLGVVLSGGMRSITIVQAVQFWLKLVAVAVPAVVFMTVWNHSGVPSDPTRPGGLGFQHATTVEAGFDTAFVVAEDTRVRVEGVLDRERYDGDEVVMAAGPHEMAEGTSIRFPAGARVPHADHLPDLDGEAWGVPFGGRDHPLFATYSALAAILLGTMGLPHIVVRFYTNTGGAAARRTAALVPVLLALFYVFPSLFGALGRLYTPELLMTGETDATLLMLPARLVPGTPGLLLAALLAAGAFAAFTSTSCGIVVAIAGTLSQCVLRGGVASFRWGAVLALAVPLTIVSPVGSIGAASLVSLAFTISAASLCPLLVLGIWWRRLSAAGAVAGLAVGGGLSVAAGLWRILGGPHDGWGGALLAQPTIVIVPVAFAVMVGVSLVTDPPAGAGRAMARLHLPEEIGVR